MDTITQARTATALTCSECGIGHYVVSSPCSTDAACSAGCGHTVDTRADIAPHLDAGEWLTHEPFEPAACPDCGTARTVDTDMADDDADPFAWCPSCSVATFMDDADCESYIVTVNTPEA